MNKRDTPDAHAENLQRIEEYLQDKDVQERIRKRMLDARSNATVSISSAARLFGFSGNQLRDWERRGLLKTERPSIFATQEGRGHRQYSTDELDKLALIKELVDGCGLIATEIPTTIDDIWRSLSSSHEQQQQHQAVHVEADKQANLPINQRIENARAELTWRYFVSHILPLSLRLISEDIPGTTVGLVLPLHRDADVASIQQVEDLPRLSESLIAWQSQSLSSHILLTLRPSFEYSTDYRVQRLQAMKANIPQKDTSLDNTLIIVRRDVKPLTLSCEAVETIQHLLRPIYEDAARSRTCFGPGMRDVLYSSPNLENTAIYPDMILNGLADIVVRLGGRVGNRNRWRFCCILLPKDSHRPLQQRSLAVRAQSAASPHKLGSVSVSPSEDLSALSLRAFQSARVVYREVNDAEDFTIAFRNVEYPVRSVIAVPVGGEDGLPLATLYVASDEPQAFPEKDRRVLRMMSKIVEELLITYDIRQHEIKDLGKLIVSPDIVDALLGIFPSENEFIHDLEELLQDFKTHMNASEQAILADTSSPDDADTLSAREQSSEDVVSFIAVDVNKMGNIATKYGDQMVRNLCWEVGRRILGELESTFKKYKGCRCYHIYADRFYILLKNVSFEQVKAKAILLKKSLDVPYKVSVLPILGTQPLFPDSMQDVTITVRLAVSSFTDETLTEILRSHPDDITISNARSVMDRSLIKELKKGMAQGGDVIMAWNPRVRRHEQLPMED